MQRRMGTAVLLAVGLIASTAQAAEYPERAIQLINPNSPGGGTDIGILTWQPHMEKCLGANVAMISVPGGTGAVGFTQLATSKADGYTVGSLNMPQFVTNTIVRKAAWSIDSVEYLGSLIGQSPMAVVKKGGQFKTLEDFTKFALASKAPVNVGVGGLGAAAHLVALRYMKLIKANFNFIPFGDGNAARNGILGNHVEITFISDNETQPFKDDLMPLAASGKKRPGAFPDVPTFGELGYDITFANTHIIGAPKGTPAPALAKWRKCINETATSPTFLADIEKRNVALAILTAEEAEAMVRQQEKVFQEMWKEDPWLKQ